MRVEIRESKNHKKIHELAMKVVDMVNATECDPFEIASALSKFLKGIYEIYKSFRVIGKSRIYSFIEKWSK